MKKILIIEDDYQLNNTLAYTLRASGYTIDSAYNAKEAFSFIKIYSYILIILDINLPDGNGFDLYKSLKDISDSSVIFLTANDLEQDVIKGFDLGADDYITKPFSLNILQRKITALIKRLCEKQEEFIFNDGFLSINFSKNEFAIKGQPIDFTPLESKILNYFILNKKHILKRDQILNDLWDVEGNFVGDTSLNAIISRIRKKIEIDGHHYIKTIYGTGYMWIGE